MVQLSLYNQLKNLFSLIIQIFLIFILTIFAAFLDIPKIYFLILVFIFSFVVNSYSNNHFKCSIFKLVKKLGYYIVLFVPFAFCLYLLDIPILNTINCDGSDIDSSESSSKNSNDDLDKGLDSPPDTGGGFINSPFENEIPLISMLDNLFILNYVELGLMFSILFIIIRLYLNPKLKILILKLLNYFFKNKDEVYNKEIKINYIFDNFTKYSPYAIVFLFIILLCIKLINLYFLFYLTENIDSFVKVYNYLIKK
jgi:hypothetical protein